jgi:polyhydroxybutyrate depolymerase
MKSKSVALIILIGLLFTTSCKKEEDPYAEFLKYFYASAGENAIVYNYNGVQREYLLYKPDSLPKNAPLVFVMHGYGEVAERYYVELGFNQIADTAKFAVCYPQGENFTWDVLSINSRDVGFLTSLAKSLQKEHSLSMERTFATGFSMGGAMSNRLALDGNDVFKAVAPVSGFVSGEVWSAKKPKNSIPVFLIHGVEDEIVSIDGELDGPSIVDLADYYATFNQCQTSDTIQFNSTTFSIYNRDGNNDHETWLYTIVGHGHAYPGDKSPKVSPFDKSGFNGAEEVWRFFSKW